MSYVAPDPEADIGTPIPNYQCVAYVRKAAGCPHTSKWAEGKKVRGADVPKGTAIATFQNGTYNNYTDGRSHAAILISQTKTGLQVLDQWVGKAVGPRTISFDATKPPKNDGNQFSVIEDTKVLRHLERARKRRELGQTPGKARKGAVGAPKPPPGRRKSK